MSQSITERLLEMQQSIARRRAELNRLEGQREEPMKALRAEFKVSTLAEAKKMREALQKELVELDARLEKDMRIFERDFPQLSAGNND